MGKPDAYQECYQCGRMTLSYAQAPTQALCLSCWTRANPAKVAQLATPGTLPGGLLDMPCRADVFEPDPEKPLFHAVDEWLAAEGEIPDE